MQFTCKYTGLKLALKGFDSVSASFAHPICQLDTLQLNKVAAKQLGSAEEKLLCIAYLSQLPCIHWERSCQFDKVTNTQINSWLPTVVRLANWLHRAPAKLLGELPQYRVTEINRDLANLNAYLEALESYREWGSFFTKDSSRSSWETSEEIKEARQAILQRKAAQTQNFEAVILWACDYLLSHVENFGMHSYKILTGMLKGRESVLSTMKEAKVTCLEWLPERTSDDEIRKSAVIQRIDTLILKKLQFLQAVGVDISKEEETLTSIQASYTIEVGGREYLNSAATPVSHLKSILAGDNATSWNDTRPAPMATPESEPRREDYKNTMLYTIAVRKWKEFLASAPMEIHDKAAGESN
jgi:hypothetical protein